MDDSLHNKYTIVKKHRVIGFESLMSKKRPRTKKEIVCEILSYDDEED